MNWLSFERLSQSSTRTDLVFVPTKAFYLDINECAFNWDWPKTKSVTQSKRQWCYRNEKRTEGC
jgi:hypothetical protein